MFCETWYCYLSISVIAVSIAITITTIVIFSLYYRKREKRILNEYEAKILSIQFQIAELSKLLHKNKPSNYVKDIIDGIYITDIANKKLENPVYDKSKNDIFDSIYITELTNNENDKIIYKDQNFEKSKNDELTLNNDEHTLANSIRDIISKDNNDKTIFSKLTNISDTENLCHKFETGRHKTKHVILCHNCTAINYAPTSINYKAYEMKNFETTDSLKLSSTDSNYLNNSIEKTQLQLINIKPDILDRKSADHFQGNCYNVLNPILQYNSKLWILHSKTENDHINIGMHVIPPPPDIGITRRGTPVHIFNEGPPQIKESKVTSTETSSETVELIISKSNKK